VMMLNRSVFGSKLSKYRIDSQRRLFLMKCSIWLCVALNNSIAMISRLSFNPPDDFVTAEGATIQLTNN
jgi:hypothetical protein